MCDPLAKEKKQNNSDLIVYTKCEGLPDLIHNNQSKSNAGLTSCPAAVLHRRLEICYLICELAGEF